MNPDEPQPSETAPEANSTAPEAPPLSPTAAAIQSASEDETLTSFVMLRKADEELHKTNEIRIEPPPPPPATTDADEGA